MAETKEINRSDHKNYWSLLVDSSFQQFFSGRSTKIEHGQMQSLFDRATRTLADQGEKAEDVFIGLSHTSTADFQIVINESYRLYSPIGCLISDADFDYYKASSYVPDPFPKDEWLQRMVSAVVGFTLTKDQALMLMHLEVIHDNYEFEDFPEQIALCAQHFALWYPYNPQNFPAWQPSLNIHGESNAAIS